MAKLLSTRRAFITTVSTYISGPPALTNSHSPSLSLQTKPTPPNGSQFALILHKFSIMGSTDKWTTQITQEGNLVFFLQIQPGDLDAAARSELRRLKSEIEAIRQRATSAANTAVGSENITDNTEKEIRRAYLIQDAFHRAPELSPVNSQRRVSKMNVKAGDFHAEIIKLASQGIDLPVATLTSDFERLIQEIKQTFSQGGEANTTQPRYLIGTLFNYSKFTADFSTAVRLIHFDVDAALKEIAQGKATTSKVTLEMTFNTTDWVYTGPNK
ncbi:hypothetical protein BDZ91DRAFT_849574 [Kalaharituber pfeilii]|nr:hypothetical protein BDZ91DRAFT_849574 [Kalaharituber pfeilii]